MARVRLNRAQINATVMKLTLPLMHRTGQQILDGAKHLAPEGSHLSGSGKPRRGQPLRPSLFSSLKASPTRVNVRIGSRVNHAATVEQGSRAHYIYSRKGKMLKFRWDRGDFLVAARAGRRKGNRRTGQFHYFASVRHPGNKRPVRYLTIPLAMYGRLNGFKVTTSGVNRTRLP
jgi:hypothetical protein